MIEVVKLSKAYGPVQALCNVSFRVAAGEVIGLLGPNGAGKTTLMKVLTGYIQPDSGQARIDGLDVLTDTLAVQKRIGYLPENAPLYPELSVQAYLQLIARLRQLPPAEHTARILDAAQAVGLTGHLTRPIGQLSKGYRQRVGLAQAILHHPKLLILDEPTVGLDPTQIVAVRRLIRRLAQNCTVLLSTHILAEVEATCDRAIILLNGQVKADARLTELAAQTDVLVTLAGEAPDISSELNALGQVERLPAAPDALETTYRLRGSDGADLRAAVYELAKQRNWPLRELRRETKTLEMVFNELTTAAKSQANGKE